MKEQWKWVRRYRKRYKVSNLGRVKSVKRVVVCNHGQFKTIRQRIMKLCPNKDGYKTVILWKKEKFKGNLVHRLVLEAFVGSCPKGQECRHLDGNPANNNLQNIKWGTKSRNQRDRKKHGTVSKGVGKGELCPRAKLTQSEVNKIRKLYKTGNYTQIVLGHRFGVCQQNIGSIINHVSW